MRVLRLTQVQLIFTWVFRPIELTVGQYLPLDIESTCEYVAVMVCLGVNHIVMMVMRMDTNGQITGSSLLVVGAWRD